MFTLGDDLHKATLAQPITTGQILVNKLRHFLGQLRPPLAQLSAAEQRRQLFLIAEHAAAGLGNFAGHLGCCPQGHFILKKTALCRLCTENAQTPIQGQGQLLFQHANHRQ